MSTGHLEHRRIEAQIADHMVNVLAQFSMQEPIYAVTETNELKPVTVREDGATVVRTYLPEYTMEDSKVPRLTITPFSFLQNYISRSHMQERYAMDVVVHQRLVGDPVDRGVDNPQMTATWAAKITEHGDHVTKLSEQVRLYFERADMRWAKIEQCAGCECARWMSVQAPGIYETGTLVSSAQIVMSLQRHTWMTVRELCACG